MLFNIDDLKTETSIPEEPGILVDRLKLLNTGKMEFTEEQIQCIEELSGLNYTIKQVAMYFNLPAEDIYAEYENSDSQFRYHYDRGQLFNQAQVGKKLLEGAKNGNITAASIYHKIAGSNKLTNLKNELFGV